MDQYTEDMATAEAMQKVGGSFVNALGIALMKADAINREKLKIAFPEYYIHYNKIAERDNWYEDL